MTRFFDNVGYGVQAELVDGVWSDSITERAYYGEILSTTRYLEQSDKVNDDIRLTQRISIVADAFALENFSRIKYVSWMGVLWSVTSVEIERPRLLLTLGGVYNGPRPTP
jgi:hypothetical protein